MRVGPSLRSFESFGQALARLDVCGHRDGCQDDDGGDVESVMRRVFMTISSDEGARFRVPQCMSGTRRFDGRG
jgi:hypothetical protein